MAKINIDKISARCFLLPIALVVVPACLVFDFMLGWGGDIKPEIKSAIKIIRDIWYCEL